MTRLEMLVSFVAQNRHNEHDIKEIKTYSHNEVEKAVYYVTSIMPSSAIRNINQANIWGK